MRGPLPEALPEALPEVRARQPEQHEPLYVLERGAEVGPLALPDDVSSQAVVGAGDEARGEIEVEILAENSLNHPLLEDMPRVG